MRKKRFTDAELRAAGAFAALTLGIGAVGTAQDRGDAAAQCFDRPAEQCLVVLTDPVEPTGGGRPVQMRAPLAITTSASASFTSSVDLGAQFDAKVRRAR